MKPNGRNYTTDPVLKRLADSDHAALILARRLHARNLHDEDFHVHDGCEDNDSNRGDISDVNASQAERDDTETGPTGSARSSNRVDIIGVSNLHVTAVGSSM